MTREQQEKILEVLGVKDEEEFYLKDYKGEYYKDKRKYFIRFTGEFMNTCGEVENIYRTEVSIFESIMTGKLTIEKVPFEPRQGERYFYVNESEEIMDTVQYFCTYDLLLMNMGNCFRTEKEAERNKKIMLEQFDKMRMELGI